MKKIMVTGIAISLVVSGTMIPTNAAENNSTNIVESESNKVFNGNSIQTIQNGNKVEIIDKKTGERVTILTHEERPYAILDDENKITYLQPLTPTTRMNAARKMGVPIPKGVNPSKFKYTFVETVRVNKKLTGSIKNITLGVLSLVPWVGPVFGISAILDEVLSLGKKELFIEYSYYYAKGYQYYKYVTCFYSDSRYKKLVKTRVDYVKMW